MSADNPTGPATSDAIDYKSMYEQESKKHQDLRAAYNRRDQEIRAAREAAQNRSRQPEPVDYGTEEEPAPQTSSKYSDQDLEDIRFRLARNEFINMNSDGKDYWNRINQVILDEAQVRQYAAWDERGRPNYEATIRSIYREMKLSEVEAARAKAAASTPVQPVSRPNLAPVISGGAASAETTLPNPEDMTQEQLYEALRGESDSHDPIRGGAIGNPDRSALR